MEQTARAMQLSVARDISRADADTLVKRVGRAVGVVGGQCVRVGEQFVGGGDAWLWRYEIRGVPVDIVRTAGRTRVIVPPTLIDGNENPWFLSQVFRLALLRTCNELATVTPVPGETPTDKEIPCNPDRRKRGPRWFTDTCVPAVRNARRRIVSAFTSPPCRGG